MTNRIPWFKKNSNISNTFFCFIAANVRNCLLPPNFQILLEEQCYLKLPASFLAAVEYLLLYRPETIEMVPAIASIDTNVDFWRQDSIFSCYNFSKLTAVCRAVVIFSVRLDVTRLGFLWPCFEQPGTPYVLRFPLLQFPLQLQRWIIWTEEAEFSGWRTQKSRATRLVPVKW